MEWHSYLKTLSRALNRDQAEIWLDWPDLAHEVEPVWLPLLGIAYDSKNNLIKVVLEGLHHFVQNAVSVVVEGNGASISAVKIVDGNNAQQIVQLRDPVMLALLH
ncbi:MAG TPA: DUF5335 family protein [Rhizomicrobium sp.]|jgi:hypothetical protein